jgi:hypothetical protein
MPTVKIIEIDKKSKKRTEIGDSELTSIPTKEDKIVLEIDGDALIFKVIDVHYFNFNLVDIYVVRLNRHLEYTQSGLFNLL